MTFSTTTTEFGGLPIRDYRPGTTVDDPARYAWRLRRNNWNSESALDDYAEGLQRFLDEPWVDRVIALTLGMTGEDPYESTFRLADLAAAADRLPALTHFFVGDMTFEECECSWIQWDADLVASVNRLRGLVTLKLRGGSEDEPLSGGFDLPELTELIVESGGFRADSLAALLSSDLPRLRALELWLGADEYQGIADVAPLEPLLSGRVFPTVTRLGLRNSAVSDEIAAALPGSPVLTRITRLDLSKGTLSDTGLDALAGADLGAVAELHLDRHYGTAEAVARLVAAHPDIAISAADGYEARAAESGDDVDEWRYPEVTE
ncbi:MAG: hypothetical protein QM809_09770 [Gordonia sp. (in: high G+C Gram-positive bacteria)]|uniref:hypothetical protein n=1 Tax=Gordonia sp. (in: high G+C Gram-positive bacteria) TaxID=84139 RepID=UPI0039E67F65